jgi:hypothetical protein
MSAEYLLDGIVLDNGKLAFNKPDYLNAIAIGKIGVGNIFEVVLRKKVAKAKPNLFKYYFGPLIDTVMATNEFAGWTQTEVDHYLRSAVRSEMIEIRDFDARRPMHIYKRIAELSRYNQTEMVDFIRDVKIFLLDEHKIEIIEQV